jgi:hypothetical protein
VLAGLLLLSATAHADVVRIGVLSGYDPTVGALYVPGLSDGGASTPVGAPLWTVPKGGGVITSWSFNNAAAGAKVRLAVTRFVRWNAVVVDARSPLETIKVTNDVNTFPASIPVRGGEQISLDVPIPDRAPTPGVCYWGRNVSEEFAFEADGRNPTGAEGEIGAGRGYEKTRVNITATIDTSGGSGTTPGPAPPGNPADTAAPTVSGLRIRSRVIAGRQARIAYKASEPATATFLVQRRTSRGWRYLTGALTHAAQAGPNALRWNGRLNGRRLGVGRYRLTMMLNDSAGNVSRPSHAGFRVVRRR